MNKQKSKPKSLSQAALQAAEKEGFVVMVFCDSKYKRLLENWLLYAENNGEEFPILICALDRQLADEMAGRGYRVCHIPWSGPVSELWRIRVRAIKTVLEMGIDVVHSDVDAVWCRSPLPFLRENRTADIIASQGTIWPPSVLSKWGHVLCFGFVCFRSTKPVAWLVNRLATASTNAAKHFDDQQILNRTLSDLGVEWELGGGGYELAKDGKKFQCYEQTIAGGGKLPDGSPIRVSLLPHRLFQRLPNNIEKGKPVLAHPVAMRNRGSDSETELRRINCWGLK